MDGRSRQNPAYRLAKGKGSARGPFPFERWFAGACSGVPVGAPFALRAQARIPSRGRSHRPHSGACSGVPVGGAPRPPGSGADSLSGTQAPPALGRLLDLVARGASLDPVVAKA